MTDDATPEELGRALRLLADTIDPKKSRPPAPQSFANRLAARRARLAEDDGTGDDGQPMLRRRIGRRRRSAHGV